MITVTTTTTVAPIVVGWGGDASTEIQNHTIGSRRLGRLHHHGIPQDGCYRKRARLTATLDCSIMGIGSIGAGMQSQVGELVRQGAVDSTRRGSIHGKVGLWTLVLMLRVTRVRFVQRRTDNGRPLAFCARRFCRRMRGL